MGFTTVACASSGNLANAVAAAAAAAGLRSVVFIPSDLEPAKVVTNAVYGQTLIAIDGSYDDVQGILNSRSQANITPTAGNGSTFSRSYDKVLNIVYLNPAKTTKGGFYPAGVHGVHNTSS